MFGLAAIQHLTCDSNAILFFIHIYDSVIQYNVLTRSEKKQRLVAFLLSLVFGRLCAGYFQQQHSKKEKKKESAYRPLNHT